MYMQCILYPVQYTVYSVHYNVDDIPTTIVPTQGDGGAD